MFPASDICSNQIAHAVVATNCPMATDTSARSLGEYLQTLIEGLPWMLSVRSHADFSHGRLHLVVREREAVAIGHCLQAKHVLDRQRSGEGRVADPLEPEEHGLSHATVDLP